ncbi:hypothetical protein F5Y14DRAFT_310712 [Nemania sp. NC0429]|nr:hypothetical protein F5Y14DRAFT_310712 [Nemania sp. NC0429]
MTASPSAMASAGEQVSPVETAETTHTTSRTLTPIPETDPVTIFHPDADLKVIIPIPNGDPVACMVCTSSLACASPIWRAMLFCDAARARDAEPHVRQEQIQTMELSGDPEAVSLLFHIIHFNFSHVPKEPTLNQLFEIGKSACQYRCTHIVYPWAEQWLSRLSNFESQVDCYSHCHKALHIAWTFGELKLFRDTVDALIVSARIDANGKIVNISGHPLEDMLMPRDLLEIISKARASTVAKILDAIRAPVNVLSSGEQSQRESYCKVGKDVQACEVMMLGSLIPALTKAGLFPVPEPEKFTGSIANLKHNIDEAKTIPYIGKEWMPHMSHERCNLGFRESVMTCLKEMAVPLSASIMSWMSDQANTCGIKATEELEEWRRRSEESPHKYAEKPDLESDMGNQKDEVNGNVRIPSTQEHSEGGC